MINYEGQALTNTIEIANTFNQYYTKTVTNINTRRSDPHKASLLLRYKKTDNITQMKIIPITETEVKTIMSLKSKSSTGYDGISNTILKHSIHFISKPLTHICRCSVASGIFPERCKFAIIRPIYKKGEKKEIINYRPISLLTSMSKVLEIIMFKRLETHLETNNILAVEQFGFKKGVHIDSTIFNLTNNILT